MHNEKPRDYIGLSSCGEHELLLCVKKLGFIEKFSNRTKMIFFTGHLWEALIIDAMKSCGLEISGQQDTLEFHGFKGHIDAMIDEHLLEFKTMSDASFKRFIKDPTSNMKYVFQLGVYSHCIHAGRAGWICLNKQTMELSYVPFPWELYDHVLEEVVQKSQILTCVNSVSDLKYVYKPEGKKEIYKKEETGKLLLPMFISYSPFSDAFYKTYDETNGYGKLTCYVERLKTQAETEEWFNFYPHKTTPINFL